MAIGALKVVCSGNLQLRQGRPSDLPIILPAVLREGLNPLVFDTNRFTIAERIDPSNSSRVVGFGQVKPVGGAALELSSIVVEPSERGKGVGTALVRHLVTQAGQTPLYLTTVSKRAALYQRCGFREVDRDAVPAFLKFEYTVGLALAWLIVRDRLVLMQLDASSAAQQGQQGQQG